MLDVNNARDALQAIPADLPRADWVRAGMAAKAAGLDFEYWNEWSAQAGNYDAHAARDTWRSFKDGKGIGPGTLYHMAAQFGWKGTDGKPRQFIAPVSAPSAVVSIDRTRPARDLKPRHDAAQVWARCEPAASAHPYIVKKGAAGVPLEGLRVLPQGDALRIGGHAMAGALVVPAYAPGGELQSLQLIPPEGQKMNLPGCPMVGARFLVGKPESGAPLYVCEGIGAAWACWQATGRAAVCCFGWGNVGKVATHLRQKDEAARLVLVPDRGKEDAAEKIAREQRCLVARLPDSWPQNSDVGDYMAKGGGDALALLLEAATEPPKPRPLLVPIDVAGVIANPSPPPRFVWAGYCPRKEVTLLGAHGGTGKSTIALMLAVAVATGRELFGHATECGRVVFVSLEDGADVVRYRLAHICKAWGIEPAKLAPRLAIVDGTASPELFTAENRRHGETTATYAELRELAKGTSLLIVDNASDAYAGDEIQRQQVRSFIRCLAEIARANDAAVLLLAHVDKNTSRARKAEGGEGYSGSTAWNNSVRSRLFVTRDENGALELAHQKSNHGPLCEPLTLRWLENGLPELVPTFAADSGTTEKAQAFADDAAAAAILPLLAEFEGRGQYASPHMTTRNNPYALLKGEREFKALGLKREDVARIVNQCQRAGWLAVVDYRTENRKDRKRWTVTAAGLGFAQAFQRNQATAPSAPTAPTMGAGAHGAPGASKCAFAPTYSARGVGVRERTSWRTEAGADMPPLALDETRNSPRAIA